MSSENIKLLDIDRYIFISTSLLIAAEHLLESEKHARKDPFDLTGEKEKRIPRLPTIL
jgi:hypothetical protein